MALGGYSGGLLATALVVFLVVPVQYYMPDSHSAPQEELLPKPILTRISSDPIEYFNCISLEHLPPFEMFLTVSLFTLSFTTYICDWIQRKLMERRILKLNHYLNENLERLRGWDARQEQLEATLKMVQNVTSEYNLLMYLLLRQHRQVSDKVQLSHCFFDKEFDDHNFIRNPTVNV